jgi:hypothetical protein
MPPLRLYKASNSKTLKQSVFFRERVLQLRRLHRRILGDRSLCFGTLPGRGRAPRAISIDAIASTTVSIDFTAIFFNVAASHDEAGVVLPSGLRALPVAMWFISLSHDVIYM